MRADTPTPTPSASPTAAATPTVTVTYTATAGPGSYSYTVFNVMQTPLATPFVVPGNGGNSLQISYTLASDFVPGAMLEFDFPADVCDPSGVQPSTTTFYAGPLYQPNLSYAISGSSSSGYAVTVTTNVAISAGTSLIFTYGQDSAGGFSVPGITTQTTESFLVWANPDTQAESPGMGLVPAPAPILVFTATISPTVSSTPTISPTFTLTPSISPTFTISPTFSNTPIGPIRASVGFYTYPNPFDLRRFPFVTVRFPPTQDSISITIFNLAGDPVCELSQGNIQTALGFAQWNGTDDYGRIVPGGLYFVRFKTPTRTVVHKMTVFH